jgi:hypothetical protein
MSLSATDECVLSVTTGVLALNNAPTPGLDNAGFSTVLNAVAEENGGTQSPTFQIIFSAYTAQPSDVRAESLLRGKALAASTKNYIQRACTSQFGSTIVPHTSPPTVSKNELASEVTTWWKSPGPAEPAPEGLIAAMKAYAEAQDHVFQGPLGSVYVSQDLSNPNWYVFDLAPGSSSIFTGAAEVDHGKWIIAYPPDQEGPVCEPSVVPAFPLSVGQDLANTDPSLCS